MKSPDAEGSWENLRKAGEQQAKLMPGIYKNKPPCVVYVGAGLAGPEKSPKSLISHSTMAA